MKLGLFFTWGMSVEDWDRVGLLDREKLLYEKLIEERIVDEIFWFTYGPRDKRYEKILRKGIVIVPMPRVFWGRMGKWVYSICAPLLLGFYLRRMDVFKTNQMRGSWTAVLASYLFRKPLIVRTGYTWSLFAEKTNSIFSLDRFARFFEWLAYRAADHAIVSSRRDADVVQKKYGFPSDRLHVIGNYIDVSVFKPDITRERYKDRLIFVGRLVEQKNLDNLIRSLSGLPYRLDVYFHDGKLKNELERIAVESGSQIFFEGAVRNRDLNAVLNKYSMFVLPSLYEGTPKVLLEAMACGLAVIGTNVEGINEIIKHDENGYLINGTGSDDLRKGIQAVAADPQRQKKLGEAASRTIQKEFSLESAVKKEANLYSLLVKATS